MPYIRKKAIQGLAVGDTFTVSRTFAQKDTIEFADISRDYNPVHFDERFAKVKNFEAPVCHGLLVASLLTEIGGQIGWLASGMNFKFKKPVYFGDTVTCDFAITDIDERGRAKAEALFTNQDQITVLKAILTGIVPGIEEQRVMAEMLAEGDPTNKSSGIW
ncbi:MAG: MaoC family dehydratase [Deltaproteobacteria bacterium]|nr:MAG: MaoC family dehydratase [Deltaproteobacteria bacterium]